MALKSKDNFGLMREKNWDMLRERADYDKNMETAEKMYYRLLDKKSVL